MSAMLFGSNRIIPLWNPSPGLETDPQEWRYHVNIGDVGFFNDEGGFDTLFNIFLPKEQNHDHHHTPPDDFVHCTLNPRLALRDVALPPSKRVMARGFAGLPNDRFEAQLCRKNRIQHIPPNMFRYGRIRRSAKEPSYMLQKTSFSCY
jgi:hypothetical protein